MEVMHFMYISADSYAIKKANVRALIDSVPVEETVNPIEIKVFDDEEHDALEDDSAPAA